MKQFSFAIVTPSYTPDFERCRLLSWSIDKFISANFTHYIIVENKDFELFKKIKNANTEIIILESIIPWWINKRLPFLKNGWFSFKTLPVRNWIMQQIVKLAIAQYIKEDVLVFVDSDTVFLRPFNLEKLADYEKVRLFREEKSDTEKPQFMWHKTAHELLGIPFINYPAPRYISQINTWKRDNVLKLYQKIESVSGRGWIETLANSWHLSEYILYGVFVENILKENSGHYFDDKIICHEYWSNEPMSEVQMQNFFRDIHPQHVAMMISAKAGISVEEYETLIKINQAQRQKADC